MTPQPGNKVEIRFNNGVFFDAIVEYWSDEKSVVRLLKNGEAVIIQKTLQDVLLVKIYNELIDNSNLRTQIRQEFETLKQQPKTDENLDHLSKLRDDMNKFEREELYEKFNSPELHETTMNYELPRNLQVARPAQHTRKETERTNSQFAKELQHMFSKRH